MKITYIGHATLLIRMGKQVFLTDPNYEKSLGRFTIGKRLSRVSAPGIALDALPRLDAILLSHAHADHLSFSTLRDLSRQFSGAPVIAPAPVARWLQKKGVPTAEPIAPGGQITFGDTVVHCAEATHQGSRYGVDRWRGDANMYLMTRGEQSCFFAGDTALMPGTHQMVADQVHAHQRRLDVALLPIGHPPKWKEKSFRKGHLTTNDALELFERLRARWFIPYHWGTFNHLTSGAHDAIDRLRESLRDHPRSEHVKIIEPGETFALPAAATQTR